MKGNNMILLGFLKLTFLVEGVSLLLNKINSLVGNYGLSIVLTTILVRLALLPLTLKQEKSMKRMKELQPKLDALKKKYENDKQMLNQKTMELYKEENVNPAAGCLPILIQLPIFIALYNVFNSDLIPSTAHFLWFNLKNADMLFSIGRYNVNILPIATTLLIFMQQKLMNAKTNTNSDDAMAQSMQSMMYVMPLLMLVLFYNMPSGLNLYYFVNTLLGVIQQYYVLSRRD